MAASAVASAARHPRLASTATWLAGLLFAWSAAAAAPPLFVYPLAAKMPDGQIIPSPQTINVAQATVNVPRADKIKGVVLIIYWSTLCPTESKCDFTLIDDVIAFWRKRGQRVVLDVAPIGYPYRNGSSLQSSVPIWAIEKIRSYSIRSKVLATGFPQSDVMMPDFTDDRFVVLVTKLVRLLRRYDGNPTVAQIRIASGLMGEDNPLIGPVMADKAGFSERSWLNFTRHLAAIYFENFKSTELEFDLGRLGWLAARGSADDRRDVEAFLDDLLSHRVLLTYDGLNSESLALLQTSPADNGMAVALQYLQRYKARGGRIGLEAARHAAAPAMGDTAAIASVLRTLGPDRLVLFSEAACAGTCNDPGDTLLKRLGYE